MSIGSWLDQVFTVPGRKEKNRGAELEKQGLAGLESSYAQRDPYRKFGQQSLGAAGIPNLDGPYNPDQLFSDFKPITTNYMGDSGARAKAFNAVTNGPNRIDMVKQALSDMDTANAPVLADRFKTVGQNAARLGRLGSGQVTTDLGNIQSDYERNRILAENAAVRDATNADVQDRFHVLDEATNADNTGYARAAQQAGELRGERGTQYNLGREGLQNRIDLQGRRFNQGLQASGFGFQGDPSQTYLALGKQHTDAGNQQSADFWSGVKDVASAAANFIPGAGPAIGAGIQAVGPNAPNKMTQKTQWDQGYSIPWMK